MLNRSSMADKATKSSEQPQPQPQQKPEPQLEEDDEFEEFDTEGEPLSQQPLRCVAGALSPMLLLEAWHTSSLSTAPCLLHMLCLH